MDQCTRRIVGFGVCARAVDGPSLCRMFNRAIRGAGSPKYISSDNDPLCRFHRWKANLRVLEVTEVKTVPYLPISHPFVERLIGTIRREYLDHVPFSTNSPQTRTQSIRQIKCCGRIVQIKQLAALQLIKSNTYKSNSVFGRQRPAVRTEASAAGRQAAGPSPHPDHSQLNLARVVSSRRATLDILFVISNVLEHAIDISLRLIIEVRRIGIAALAAGQ